MRLKFEPKFIWTGYDLCLPDCPNSSFVMQYYARKMCTIIGGFLFKMSFELGKMLLMQ